MNNATIENGEFLQIDQRAGSVIEAIQTRHSVRDYDPRPIGDDVLKELFQQSLRAPSWKNSQPWKVHVVTGSRRDKLADRLVNAAQAESPSPDTVWPDTYPANAKRRMFDLGMKVYGVAGIDRKDKAARDAFMLRNFSFFGAPAAAFITTEFEPGPYITLDIGCYLESIMLLARSFGLGTCPQAALSAFPNVVRAELGLPETEKVVCGISIGYPVADSTLNRFHTPRETLADLVKFHHD